MTESLITQQDEFSKPWHGIPRAEIPLGVALALWAEPAFIDFDTLDAALRETGTHILDAAAAQARAAGIEAESAVLETDIDEPAAEILAEADRWGADLIVMGTHGRHGLAHLILGSVAEGGRRSPPGPTSRGGRAGRRDAA